MFSELIGKLPQAVHGLLRFFEWSDADTSLAKEHRQVLARVLYGYATQLAISVGFSLTDLAKMAQDVASQRTKEPDSEGHSNR